MLDRRWIARMGALGLLVACAAPARADDYPNRPVTIIIPFTAGSITDTAARIVAERLEKALGQPGRWRPARRARGRARHAGWLHAADNH